jgi:hypothetical protein
VKAQHLNYMQVVQASSQTAAESIPAILVHWISGMPECQWVSFKGEMFFADWIA